ncbi:hypothetical protein SCANM63S_07293 [Streptomyces canarius]
MGTAVYQVADTARMSSQKVWAVNRPRSGSSRRPPVASVASSPASSPCPWKNGIAATVPSAGVSSYVVVMPCRDAATLAWVSGTILAWPVVPAVNRARASSPVSRAAAPCGAPPAVVPASSATPYRPSPDRRTVSGQCGGPAAGGAGGGTGGPVSTTWAPRAV